MVCGIVPGLWGGQVAAAPAARLGSSAWQLDFKFHDPQRIVLQFPGDSGRTAYWYVLYEVTNNTGRDRGFYPSFQLVTDTLQVVEGGADIRPSVYDAIAARYKEEFPFLAPPAAIIGLILQGEENARASVAVFRTFDAEADSFTVYVSGLSGEIKRIGNPGLKPTQDESGDTPRSFILRRTLAIAYELPGDSRTRARATPVRRSREWVMR